MDANGTKYHLLYGRDDWGQCATGSDGLLLADWWAEETHAGTKARAPLCWDTCRDVLRLASETPRFARSARTAPLDVHQRRGAGRDRYGNWYWIAPDERSIRFLRNGAHSSAQWWHDTDRDAACTPTDDATFAACRPASPPTLLLRGLAVTAHHYLLVGDVTEHGLLRFDLHIGGTPILMRWPDDVPFTPWDLAPTPDGGALVLDHDHCTYWVLDPHFRLRGTVKAPTDVLFQVASPAAPRNLAIGVAHPQGYPLVDGAQPRPQSPISIEAGPDSTVLILDTAAGDRFSRVYTYRDGAQEAVYSLEGAVRVMDPRQGEGTETAVSVIGHDFAFDATGASARETGVSDCCAPQAVPSIPPPLLYVAERDGKQVFAFTLDPTTSTAHDQQTYLPLRRWGGKALIATGVDIFYDFADRWVPLQQYTECHYLGSAVLTTPARFPVEVPGRPFDGQDIGCVWHRLFLDAQIPTGTAVRVRARASDDPDLLPSTPWLAQPDPYMRTGGAELPYYDPWAPHDATEPAPQGTGTWELLFQGVGGRYLQLELTFMGTGRRTPALRALRAWFPRFSYPEHYLPALYREDPEPAQFLERWLANFEGIFTNIEDRIAQVAALFDARTVPAETLDWLACWFGTALDPLWDEEQRRFFIRHADTFYRRRGTVPGIESLVRLYLACQPDERLLDPSAADMHTLRIVERFRVRETGGAALGDPTAPPNTGGPTTRATIAAAAHRFSVLVPASLPDERQAMVRRIVTLAKPAHTAFELKRFWDLFIVGQARLGLDTQLGESGAFVPFVVGDTLLPNGYLVAPYPFDVPDRMVLNRDRLGHVPAL